MSVYCVLYIILVVGDIVLNKVDLKRAGRYGKYYEKYYSSYYGNGSGDGETKQENAEAEDEKR